LIDRVKTISRIFRAISSPPALAMLQVLAGGPLRMSVLAQCLNHKSLDSARRHAEKLKAAGLVLMLKPDSKDFVCQLAGTVKVHEDYIEIDAGGLPITIGRHLKEGA
jgi:DNA-binding transcriptional ArsR family regulator